jgi:oligopeptide/dipeptide ABC transporter ATP-binding protein
MKNVQPILKVKNLSKYFNIGKDKVLKAVDDASFEIYEGETVGLVGESGCGKSTTGRCIVRLNQPTSGKIYFEDKDIFDVSNTKNLEFCKNVQMIFQNPYSSLNPRMTVKDIVGEGIKLHNKNLKDKEIENKIEELLKSVGLSKDHISRFPHEFSGGQRQRIGIARALSVNPKFIVCDEPISALDVSVQAQVINMLKKLQKEKELTFLFIAHDLSVVKYISDRVIVMYLGKIVEQGNAEELYKNPLHPYTKALLSSIPVANPRIAKSNERIVLKGEISSPINPKNCCRFSDRCSYAMPICREEMPELKDYGKGHMTSCHLYK